MISESEERECVRKQREGEEKEENLKLDLNRQITQIPLLIT